jgi:hypothetical protein
LTLIAATKTLEGLIVSADTEEVIPESPALSSRAEKIHVLSDGVSDWRIVVAGAGDADFIGMARDFIREKTAAGPGKDRDIVKAIRDSIAEIWRDYARYEPSGVRMQLLLASFSNDHLTRLTVVANTAVRDGSDLEAFGIGDATFRSLADRFIFHGQLTHVHAKVEAVRLFHIYAQQQAKKAIPGVGGDTRVLTLANDGKIKWEKQLKVIAVEDFFERFDQNVRVLLMQGITDYDADQLTDFKFSGDPEVLLRKLSKNMLQELRKLRKKLDKIENDPTLI